MPHCRERFASLEGAVRLGSERRVGQAGCLGRDECASKIFSGLSTPAVTTRPVFALTSRGNEVRSLNLESWSTKVSRPGYPAGLQRGRE